MNELKEISKNYSLKIQKPRERRFISAGFLRSGLGERQAGQVFLLWQLLFQS